MITMTNNTLSVCSFMMNEKDVVRNMLESIKSINPDEIIVVDEYSTDGTRDILNSYGVKIVDGALNNDYSAIRNLALSNVKNDINWILFIDADEILDNALIDALKSRELLAYLDDNKYDCAGIRRKNYITGNVLGDVYPDLIVYPDYQVRLFRNIKDKDGNNIIKYVGNIHEQLTGYNNRWLGDDRYHIIHSKTGDRQLMQNRKYNIIYRKVGISHLINPRYD